MKSRLLIVLIAAATLLSCNTNKENTLAYFRDLKTQEMGSLPMPKGEYKILIQPDDELVISVTSAVPEATAVYNLPMDNPAIRGNLRMATQPRTQTYIVDEKGDVVLPVLGRVHVAGKTTNAIAEEITGMIAQNVKKILNLEKNL